MTDSRVITALVADDEDTPRAQLAEALRASWPGLRIVEAVNGTDAWDAVLEHSPTVCFLDVRMPGLTGIDVARRVASTAHVVFLATPADLTLRELEAAGVDHLRKPVEPGDVEALVARLRAMADQPPPDTRATLDRLAGQVRRRAPLEAIRTRNGREVEVVRIDDVAYFETDGRQTRVVSRGGAGMTSTPIKELVGQLDSQAFVQIDRHVLVNRRFIATLVDDAPGDLRVALTGRPERLAVAGRFHTGVRSTLPG